MSTSESEEDWCKFYETLKTVKRGGTSPPKHQEGHLCIFLLANYMDKVIFLLL